MKIRTKLTIPSVILLIILGGVAIIKTFQSMSKLQIRQLETVSAQIELSINQLSTQSVSSVHKQIDFIGQKALSLASLFAREPEVVEAYKIALTGDIGDPESPQSQRARDILRQKFAPIIDGYLENTGESLLKLHFHLPNGRSLVRLWREGYQTTIDGVKVDISDDISPFRQTVIEVNTSPYTPITGIEIGRGGFVIRGLSPITMAGGRHLGSNEVLFAFSQIIKMEQEDEGKVWYSAFMDADKLPIAKSLQDPEKFPVFENTYVLTDFTDQELTDLLITREILDEGHKNLFCIKKENYLITSFPIHDYSGNPVGVMTIIHDISRQNATLSSIEAEIAKTKNSFMIQMAITLGLITLIAVFINTVSSRLITKPLAAVEKTLKDIATGGGDLTKELKALSSDEVGVLSNAFNTFLSKLRNMVSKIKKTTESTITIKESLGSTTEETAASLTQISANIKSAKSLISTLDENINTTSSAANQIQAHIQDMDIQINEQSSAVEQSSASVHEMVASLSNVASITQTKQNATKLLVRRTEDGGKILSETTNAVQKIHENLDSISEMVKVINNVAEQTNLLAMNAAIEAAHAGDAGRGFSVVADEIRKLAEDVSKNAKEISVELNTIIGGIETAASSSLSTNKAFTEIREEVESVYRAFEEISLSTSELSNGGEQIIKAMDLLNQITQKVRDSSTEMTTDANQMAGAMETVKRISTEVNGAMDEVTTGTLEISKAMDQVTALTVNLSDTSTELEEEVNRFIID